MAAESPENGPENSASSSHPQTPEPFTTPLSTLNLLIKRRQPIDDALRRKIRRRNQEYPGPQAQLRQWIHAECGRTLTQG